MARVTFFAFDIAEAAQIRRIRSVRALGYEVASVSFRRRNMNTGFHPDWPNTDIGRTDNNSFLKRFAQLGGAVVRAYRARRSFADSDVWIARNFDLLAVAWAVRLLSGQRDTKLVYECLDIHGLFTRPDALGRVMRWVERRLLSQISLLIVSSPGFLRAYFGPVQGYTGPVSLIENKIWQEGSGEGRPKIARQPAAEGPIVLGWVGSLRCKTSLAILMETAERLGPRLRVVFHGNVHRHAVPEFDALLAGQSNVSHAGPYRYPDDLAGIYAACDLVWSQDLWQRGANSDWLLPNRIYEASYHGCPSIAVADTETGRRVAQDGLGFVIETASATHLTALLSNLTPAQIRAASQHLLDMPEGTFRLTSEELAERLSPVLPPVEGPARASAVA